MLICIYCDYNMKAYHALRLLILIIIYRVTVTPCLIWEAIYILSDEHLAKNS